MAVKASHSLQQKVDRGYIGNHYIEINVKGLLDHLRAHNDELAGPAGGIGTKQSQQFRIVFHAVDGNKARMDELHARIAKGSLQLLVGALGTGNRVSQHACATTIGQ